MGRSKGKLELMLSGVGFDDFGVVHVDAQLDGVDLLDRRTVCNAKASNVLGANFDVVHVFQLDFVTERGGQFERVADIEVVLGFENRC